MSDNCEDSKKVLNRCTKCNKNIELMSFLCKCNNNFCIKHRFPDSHNCSFNYKLEAKEQLKDANPIIAPQKVIDI